jgi:DDE family transposase
LFEFEAVERRAVVAGFDGGDITSNAGALLLGQVDRGLGLMRRFAECFTDRRDPRYVEHRVETLVGQRIFGLMLGYEDLNDHDELRKDRTFAVLAGKLKPVIRSDCEALAGKSTLNRLEHTPKRHGSKYHKIDCDGAQVDALFVALFLEAHERAPREIVLDLDNTTSRSTAGRKAASFTATTTNTAICRSMYSAAGTCCWPGSGARTSPAATARSRRSRVSSRRSVGNGRGSASSCAPTAAAPTMR